MNNNFTSVHRGFLLIVCFICSYSAAIGQIQEGFYCNARFGYCLDYPTALLTRLPEAQNGDGCIFEDRNGVERLRVYGNGNWNYGEDGQPVSLSELYQQELKGGRFAEKKRRRIVSYKAFRRTGFVISGKADNEIFYLKVVERESAFCFAYLHYPAALADLYEPVAVSIGKTFR